jgi:macrolide transport system ATP-binding/permease protein
VLPRLRSLWRNLVHRGRRDRDLDEEVTVVFDLAVEEKIRGGLDPAQARRQALLELGRPSVLATQVREERAGASLDTLWRDLTFGIRLMRRAPLFAVTAIVSLALGIGATSTIFTLVDALLLRDLRVGHPEQLVEIARVTPYGRGGSFSYPIYRSIRDGNQVFSGTLAISRSLVQAGIDATPLPIGRIVSENFFELLEVSPQLGRVLTTEDGRPGTSVAVISHAFWQRQFGGVPTVVGTSLPVESVRLTIVGVLPAAFDDPVVGRPADFYIPIASEPLIRRQSWLERPDFNWLAMIGRLKPDVPIGAAQANLDPVFARTIGEIGQTIRDPESRQRYLSHRVVLESARGGLADLRRQFARPVVLLMTAVTLVLLIACTNVVNLLLARGVTRRREMALRLAIGASRGRLIRQMLTESVILGLAGGLAGFLLSRVGAPMLIALVSDGLSPVHLNIEPDARILTFTIAVALASSLIVGLLPALRTARVEIASDMDASPRPLSASRGAARWSQALIAVQVALSLLLLIGAVLILTSLRNIRTFDAGFNREQVLLQPISPERAGFTGDQGTRYWREVLERVRAVPGVRAAGLSLITPISGGGIDLTMTVEDRRDSPRATVYVNRVSDGFLSAMGTPLRRGRDFTPRDAEGSPVAIVNDALVQRFFRNEDPIGRRVTLGNQPGVEIVGVVGNAKYLSLREQDVPTIYSFVLNGSDNSGLQLTIRTTGDPRLLAPVIRREVQSIAAAVRVPQPRTLTGQIDQSLVTERLVGRLLGAFAALALLLAAVGLYGVLGYSVARRTGEIGLRLALGAERTAVLQGVLRESAVLAAIGSGFGVPASLLLSRALESLLFDVKPSDPIILTACVVSLFAVALVAAAVPAWRASRVDPMVALRRA